MEEQSRPAEGEGPQEPAAQTGSEAGAEAGGAGAPEATPEKDPSDWVTGEEPMTGPQASYLKTLCQEAGEDFDEKLTKAEASRRIDELQQKTGRGK
jgi:hypothetical protein